MTTDILSTLRGRISGEGQGLMFKDGELEPMRPVPLSELQAAADEIERLRAALERYPKTIDGVPMYPGMTIYFVGRDYRAVKVDAVSKPTGFADFYAEGNITDNSVLSMADQYASTREAAERAAKEKA